MTKKHSGLRWVLREKTADTHKQLDHMVSSADLATRDGLTQFLLGNLHAHTALMPHDQEFDGHMRRRIALIEADCGGLQVGAHAKALSPQPINAAMAIGYRYVIAGSAMGGRILAKRCASSADAGVREAAQFLGDDRLMTFWKDVQGELDGLPETGPEAEAAIAGANACFELFSEAFQIAMDRVPERLSA